MTHNTTTTATTGEVTAVDRRGLGRIRELDWRRYVIYIGFVVVFLFFAVLLGNQGFLSANNLLNIFRQTAIITVIAVAMTYVIAAAEIDLSVGSVAGLSSVCTAMALSRWGLVAGIIAGLAVGLVIGSVNSGPIPGLLLWSAAFVVVGAVVLAKTRYGRQVLATGGNRTAAEFTGVNTRRIKFSVLLLCSMCAAVAGMLYAGRLQSGRFQWGSRGQPSGVAGRV